MTSFRLPRRFAASALAWAVAQAFSTSAAAQVPPASVTDAASPDRVVVTGNPLGRDDIAQPTHALSGDRLTVQRAASLGQTLDGLPGVSATWFGPNANRPTIRGLDGDRVRVLDNAGATVNASSLSFDHAVAVDPLVVERIEVLRGPASLLYGGNATGGVVNTIDNRIPRAALEGVSGRAEGRWGGAADERALSALVEAGAGGVNWHVDAFARAHDDLRVPRFVPIEDGVAAPATTRVRNSAADAQGGAVGASWTDARGYAGLSADTYRHHYGVTVEPDVHIEMDRERLAFATQRYWAGSSITELSVRASDTRYAHREVEGDGAVGTTFSSRGQEARVELHHAPVFGTWQGAFGVQAESLRFQALGEEAFVPDTRTRSAALFWLEEGRVGDVSVGVGVRVERVDVRSAGDPEGADEPRFGEPARRRFTPANASLSMQWPLSRGWSASGVLGLTERAPAYYELYANGLHVATGVYEQGDTELPTEQGQHLDVGLQWKGARGQWRAHAYAMRFARYLSLDATGRQIDVTDDNGGVETVAEYRFQAVPARLWGLEVEGRERLWSAAEAAGWQLDGRASWDVTRGRNLAAGEPLPRLAPMRLTLGLDGAQGDWRLGAEVRHALRQSEVPSTDVPTPAYTLLNLWASRAWVMGPVNGLAFMRLDNLGNALATSAGALRSMREMSPLPGRSATVGLRASF